VQRINICIVNKPVSLLIFPSEQVMQSKQQTGSPFLLAIRVPGGQLSLHTDFGGYGKNKLIMLKLFHRIMMKEKHFAFM